MDEERKRILKLLEEGKISAQEAERLLLALKDQPKPDMSRDELRLRMRRLGLREARKMPEIAKATIAEAWNDGLTAAVRKQKFEFPDKGKVLLRNATGDIRVQGWSKATVLFDREEGGLWKATEREDMVMAKVLSGDIRASVPHATHLIVSSVSGDIKIRDIAGKIEAKSVSGDISLKRTSSTAEVSTVSGKIKTRDIRGKCHLTTLSGDIDLGFQTGLSGVVEAKTGSIQVWVPSDANLLLEVDITVEGKIAADIAIPCEKLEEKPRHLKLGFGGKEHRLWVRCREGDVEIGSYEPEETSEHKDKEEEE